MANLQIKGIQNDLYERIKEMAASENRSMSQQILFLIREYMVNKGVIRSIKPPAQILLELSGSWEDDRDAEQILTELKHSRKSSTKLREGF